METKNFLGTKFPIIQAPMVGVQDSALAIAVSNAGGLGSLPCAMLAPETLRVELKALKSQTVKPFNVNFFCHTPPEPNIERGQKWLEILNPYFKEFKLNSADITKDAGREPFSVETAEILAEFKPSFVSFHFGLPARNLLKRVKDWGATILASATTIEEAKWLETNGADAIIAQGIEAGGHRGMFLSTDLSTQIERLSLVTRLIEQMKLPIIAAGGISSAKDVAEAISLGASAVQIGTAYLLCPETKTSPIHRAALKSEDVKETVLTNIFSGRPARGLINRFIREIGPINADAPEFPLASAAVMAIRKKAEAVGSGDFSPLWCGQNVSGCLEIPAAELTLKLAAEL
ncbi:MAG: nitronate monooxygenase [SAR324 cluster bacterium]|nr:nitronate monooxygenase [SAR324 cluster bacterium]